MTKRKAAGRGVMVLVALFLLIQLVPYGRNHLNPPVTKAISWNSPRTARLFAQACQDCHSNLSKWRWYDNIAPGSWLVEHDIQGARQRLNVSEWDKPQPSLSEVVRAIESGSMPPLQYKVVHTGGQLSDAQRKQLVQGFIATYKKDPPKIRQDQGEGDG